VGSVLSWDGFGSTSSDESKSRDFANGGGNVKIAADKTYSVMVEADIPEARDISNLSVNGQEMECLAPPGTKLLVERIIDEADQPEGSLTNAPAATAWKRVYLCPPKWVKVVPQK
jgi:hypothetical protein